MTRHLTSMLAAAVLLVATAGFAQGPGFGPGPGMGRGPGDGPMGPGRSGMGMGPGNGECLTNYLGLTDEQVTAWQSLRDQLHTTLEPIHAQRKALHDQIQAALTGGAADPCGVGQLMVQAHALGDQARAARDANQAAFMALLTTEQQAKYQHFLDLGGVCRGQRGPRGAGMHRGRAQGQPSGT